MLSKSYYTKQFALSVILNKMVVLLVVVDQPTSTMTSAENTFIPVRTPPPPSVYTSADFNNDGSLRVLRSIPDGDQLASRRAAVSMGHVTSDDVYAAPEMPPTPLADGEEKKKPVSKYAAAIRRQREDDNKEGEQPTQEVDSAAERLMQRSKTALAREGEDALAHVPKPRNERVDVTPGRPVRHVIKGGKYSVATPENMRAPHREQYICVLRTIENRHPDEDAILAHYFAQYVARRENKYNPIEDPPVVLTDILPTCAVILDRVFSFDDVQGDGKKKLEAYIKRMADKTDFDVIPVMMNMPFHLPLSADVAFKYKNKVIDQIMEEWHESHEESASDILARVEADRDQKPAEKPSWQVYDGISKGGAFAGNNAKITTMDDPADDLLLKQRQQEQEEAEAGSDDYDDDDGEDNDEEEEKKPWTTVKTPLEKLQARKPIRRAAGGRRMPLQKPRSTTASRRV